MIVCTLDDLSLIKASICMSPRLDANIKLMIKSIVKEPTNRPAIKINISSPLLIWVIIRRKVSYSVTGWLSFYKL
jgi:hypothetical protein